MENVKIKGHRGTFYQVDETHYHGKKVFLMESEIYGNDCAHIIIDKDLNIVLEDVWNGFEDLFEFDELL